MYIGLKRRILETLPSTTWSSTVEHYNGPKDEDILAISVPPEHVATTLKVLEKNQVYGYDGPRSGIDR